MSESGKAAVLHRLGFLLDRICLVQVVACITPQEAEAVTARLSAWREGDPDPEHIRVLPVQPVAFADERRALSPTQLVEEMVARCWPGARLDNDLTWPTAQPALADMRWWQAVNKEAAFWDRPTADSEVLVWSFTWEGGEEADTFGQHLVKVPTAQLEMARSWLYRLGLRQETLDRVNGSSVASADEAPAASRSLPEGLEHLAKSLLHQAPEHPWVGSLRAWALALRRQEQALDSPLPNRSRPRA